MIAIERKEGRTKTVDTWRAIDRELYREVNVVEQSWLDSAQNGLLERMISPAKRCTYAE